MSRNFHSGFFTPELAPPLPPSCDEFPEPPSIPSSRLKGYLDKNHSCFSLKLKAAIDVWEAIANSTKPSGHTPKQRIEKWLKENAKQYDLLNSDGEPNKTAIEEIAKIVHWRPKGGLHSQKKQTDEKNNFKNETENDVLEEKNVPVPPPF